MTTAAVVSTLIGAFMFPFLISLIWGRLVENFGPIGGWMAGGFIVGTTWMLNHALPGIGFQLTDAVSQHGLINQADNGAWIDMGWAAGFGLWVGAIFGGANLGKSIPTFVTVALGGAFGGLILSLITK